ncbi:class III lanthipeptide [Secundilactobacillus paracollinoides]
MNKLVSLQKTAIDADVTLLRHGSSKISLGCHNISTISLYFCE